MQPEAFVKSVQRALLIQYFYQNLQKWSETAIAYRPEPKASILDHVKRHAQYEHSLRLDIREFFPSLTMELAGKHGLYEDIADSAIKRVLEKYTFARYRTGGMALAIGSPVSPSVANLILSDYDRKLQAEIETLLGMEYYFTRYADDIVVSSNDVEMLHRIKTRAIELLQSQYEGKLQFNSLKTRVSRVGNKRIILGLVISDDRKVGIGRVAYRNVTSRISKCLRNRGNRTPEIVKEVNSIKGLLSYIQGVDKTAYNRIANKYGDSLLDVLYTT